MSPELKDISYIIFGVISIATFITIFFFTYVSKVEGDVVKIQMKRIVDDLVGGTDLIFTPEQKKAIGDNIKNISVPDMTDSDAEVATNNNKLKKEAMKIFGSLIIAGIAIIFLCASSTGLI